MPNTQRYDTTEHEAQTLPLRLLPRRLFHAAMLRSRHASAFIAAWR